MVEKVTMYRAADGSLHENEALAIAVDRAVTMRAAIEKMIRGNPDMSDMIDSFDNIKRLATFLVDKRHRLLEILA